MKHKNAASKSAAVLGALAAGSLAHDGAPSRPAADSLEQQGELGRPAEKPLSRRAALCLAASAAALFATGCSQSTTSSDPVLKTYLDGGNLSFEGDRAVYTVNGKAARVGVDVSEHQGFIDWSAVAADGISFAFIRLGNRGSTEGGLYPDEYVTYNVSAAQAAGLEVHGYFYSQALTSDEAIEEADYAMGIARSAGLSSGYLAFDLETEGGRTYGMADDAMTAAAQAFCTRVEQGGYRSLVYGNRTELLSFGKEVWDSRPIWLAQYTYANPESPCAFSIWQYASDGAVAGIDTQVDLNVWVEE